MPSQAQKIYSWTPRLCQELCPTQLVAEVDVLEFAFGRYTSVILPCWCVQCERHRNTPRLLLHEHFTTPRPNMPADCGTHEIKGVVT